MGLIRAIMLVDLDELRAAAVKIFPNTRSFNLYYSVGHCGFYLLIHRDRLNYGGRASSVRIGPCRTIEEATEQMNAARARLYAVNGWAGKQCKSSR